MCNVKAVLLIDKEAHWLGFLRKGSKVTLDLIVERGNSCNTLWFTSVHPAFPVLNLSQNRINRGKRPPKKKRKSQSTSNTEKCVVILLRKRG